MVDGAIAADKSKFADNEKAQEAAYIRKAEYEKLKALKKKLTEQKQTIEELEKEIDGIGERNAREVNH